MLNGVERIYVACDVSNLWHGCRAQFGKRACVDFQILSEMIPALARPQPVKQRLMAYLVSNPKDNHHAFYNALRGYGFGVRERFMAYAKGTPLRTNWDIGITIDAIHSMGDYDTFVLMSGDGDFSELMTYLRKNGKKTVVAAFDNVTSEDLKQASDAVIPLTKSVTYFLEQ